MPIGNAIWNIINGNNSAVPYLVDTYSPEIAVSLYKLSSTATNCLRVRRTSDSTEQDIGFSGNYMDTASLESFCSGTDGYVTTWYDQSGNANNLTQSTAGNQPQIVSSGTASEPFFNTDWLENTSVIMNSGVSQSLFVNVRAVNLAQQNYFFSYSKTALESLMLNCDSRSLGSRHFFIRNTSTTNYTADLSTNRNDTNWRLLTSFCDASKNMSAFDNGATGGTNTWTGSINNNGVFLGRAYTNYGVVRVRELIAFNSDETSNRTAIETNINDRWSVY